MEGFSWDTEYFKRRHSLNARQTRRYVGNSLTTATEGEKNFLGFEAVKHQVVDLSPVLNVVELTSLRALIGCWDDDITIVNILAQLISLGRRPQV